MTKTFEEGQGEIARLTKDFGTNRRFYLAPEDKEAQARQDLIDWLFIALGWDMRNLG